MATELVAGTIISLVIGLATALYFERRATKASRAQNNELRRQLNEMVGRIVGHGVDSGRVEGAPPVPDIATAVRARALATQDASGRVGRHDLITYFVRRGTDAADVETALAELTRAGVLREDGKWLRTG